MKQQNLYQLVSKQIRYRKAFHDLWDSLHKPLLLILIICTEATSLPLQVFAQQTTATPSAVISQPVSPSPIVPTPDNTSPDLTTSAMTGGSADLRTQSTVSKLLKKLYRQSEAVSLTVNNASISDISTKLVYADGKEVAAQIQDLKQGNNTEVEVLPPQQFRPGKYTLSVQTHDGTVTQDFLWGVLALNTNKSIYLPQETSHIAMAVLDDKGEMVCNAGLSLEITNSAANIDDTLSTANGKIQVNPQCQSKQMTLVPDYQADYQLASSGTYNLTLTATTASGSYSITDSMTVRDSVPFDVERVTATRIYPPAVYPVTFHIKANTDFTGRVVETVPASFTISQGNEGQTYDEVAVVDEGEAAKDSVLGAATTIGMPFSGKHPISLGFGQPLDDPILRKTYFDFGLAGHDGVDFDMPDGTPIYAVDDGVVAQANPNGDYGMTLVIQHSWGKSYYGHLSSFSVKLGRVVKRGDRVALSGHSGIITGPHLHFGIKPNVNDATNGYYGKVDPAPYLGIASTTSEGSGGPSSVKTIAWDVSLKKGEAIDLSYAFKMPDISPQFYTIGPLKFLQPNNQSPSMTPASRTNTPDTIVFQEARVWQLAADAVLTTPAYLSSTASSKITSTTSWQIVTSAPAASNVTIGNKISKSTGYFQWQPGTTANATSQASAPTTPNGHGFIYDTALDSTIPAGTWTFNVRTQNSSTTATGVAPVTVCVWKVTVASGAIGTSSSIIPCTDGATDIINGSTALTASSVTISSVAAQSFTSSQYLYVEYWQHVTTQSGVNNFTTNFETNAGGSDDIVLPGSSSNLAPTTPTEDSPTNASTGVSTTPTFLLTATDPESDALSYKVTIYSSSGCSTNLVQTNDQSLSQTGWTGQNATCTSGSDCYTSGTQGSYTVQSALSFSTQYWWRASAKDPNGSGTFTDSTACNSFTTGASGPTLDQLLRHGQWFSNGKVQPFTF